MLKKITSAEIRLGMYIHKFEGNWIDHPFWKARFVLQSPRDLQKIQDSAVTAVWIDVTKGLDRLPQPPADEPVVVPPSAAPLAEMPPLSPAPLESPRVMPLSTSAEQEPADSCQQELAQAAAISDHAKQEVMRLFQDVRLGKAIELNEVDDVVEQISTSVLRHPTALISMTRLRTADEYTYIHSVSVCALMTAVARQMGLPTEQVLLAGKAGLMHDVGKMLVPPEVLNKPGKLTDKEFAVMKRHPELGVALLQAWGAPAEVIDVCLHHHEKFDGSGYPSGRAGKDISLLSRIAAVCDVYDAISSTRPYKQAWSPAESIRRMAEWTGHFDPQVFQAFVKTIGIYPIGSLVRLSNEQLAVVVDQHPQSLLTPKVRVFFSARSRTPLPQRLLDLAQASAGERIVRRELPEDWGFRNLEQLWQQA
ncbi:phosphodiesterase [Pseudomonas oryzihabitans]|uniref:HD-GYP domain-containing protein n=1 Tax=Pseudomonas rhizoryzae TaxID=2571129 RepID=UPI000736C2D8|nr:HD-GYP domain-containing protein [Pseudomonas rhizoryzae]APQ12233.1 phosphodiesterase [Pseudomonas psychrotolerans]KTS78522.1 phosphodiesterase [Pseudomonas psychrotolerans]KTT12728.1 phosphodiesterase [Pseudomonas psychrotolerans]KTT28906.1 phosphodiesterase [Pseudomonas psychrotolerans]KTT35192.1 phosphodiesterase [Pseudomonas psychrotolerans]